MGVYPICRDDSEIMRRCLYCSGLLVERKDYEITHSGRLKNHKRFVIE